MTQIVAEPLAEWNDKNKSEKYGVRVVIENS